MKRIIVAISSMIAITAAQNSSAVVVDTLYFTAAPTVIVWSGVAGVPTANDFILLTNGANNAGVDLIAGADVTPVVTGSLTAPVAPAATDYTQYGNVVTPVAGGAYVDEGNGFLDGGDTYTAFTMDATTDVTFNNTLNRSFYVASNTAFDIFAGALLTSGTAPLSSIDYLLTETVSGTDVGIAYGGNAQTAGIAVAAANLGAIGAGPTQVFDGTQKTAASVGTITTQSVRINNAYTFDYDLSYGSGQSVVTVTYTIYQTP